MKAASVRICPACGIRNKPKWEFCVRCGESIGEVPVTSEAAAAAAEAPLPAVGEDFPLLATLGVVVVLGAGFAWVSRNWQGEPEQPDPAIFTPISQPPERPTATITEGVTETEKTLRQAQNLMARGRFDEALPLLAQVVSEDPGNFVARYAYGQALWATGSREDALSQYGEAARLAPQAVVYQTDYAKALSTLGRRDEAIEVYERLFEGAGANRSDVLRELAVLYRAAGTPDRALPLLERAAQLQPGSFFVQQDLGYGLEKAGREEEAESAYRRVLQIAPTAAISRGLLADLLLRTNRQEEAIALAREGVAVDPSLALSHRNLAGILERAGRMDEAIAEYKEYVRLAPGSADAKQLAQRADLLVRRPAGSS